MQGTRTGLERALADALLDRCPRIAQNSSLPQGPSLSEYQNHRRLHSFLADSDRSYWLFFKFSIHASQ